MPNSFSNLNIPPAMLNNLEHLGYTQMTPIQAKALPDVLSGKDMIAKAKTGSGKTAVFGIGLLLKLNQRNFATQALILCPTRELAGQVANELRKLARFKDNIKILTLCGGQPLGPQIGSLEHGAQIVVGTPGRISDHLRKGTLKLEQTTSVVLDEADRMLDMGFADEIRSIIDHTPKKRQTLLFSATYPDSIASLSADILSNPVQVEVESTHTQTQIEQHFFEFRDDEEKQQGLSQVIEKFELESAVIFCNMKQTCDDIADYLGSLGYSAQALHGDLEQRDRDQILVRFANHSCSFLIATDVAARGLDIAALPCVINYDLTRDAEVHTHRIGRTGRAGQQGLAINLFKLSEAHKVSSIERNLNTEFDVKDIADIPAAESSSNRPIKPPMVTLSIAGGKKNKVRPGDILGALTGDAGIAGNQVGKINVFDFVSYVAVNRSVARQAEQQLSEGKIKGRKLKIRRV